jgi:guanosine-3',5'-bis(diphosphate) 3'-pyrophosphohydrolase
MKYIRLFENFNIDDYVTKKHGNQMYGGYKPYMYHINQVKKVCDKFIDLYNWSSHDRYVIETAVMCHDLLEDTDTSYEELEDLFGNDVAQIVFNVSGFGDNRKERNKDAYSKIKTDDRSIFVKLCDRISNVEESATNMKKLTMYREEYEIFKHHVFNGEFKEMWRYLDDLF